MRQVILASTSPRRQQLLKQMGVEFEVVSSEFEEYIDHDLPAAELTTVLALGKVRAVTARYPEAVVVGGDTLVTMGERHLGKATGEAEARRVLHDQSGQTVSITSSVVVACQELGLELTAAETAYAVLKPTDEEKIEAYLASGDWRDKAGSWGLQSGAAPLVDYIKGDYDVILGMPTKELARMLESAGVKATPVKLKAPVPEHKG